MRNNRSTSRVTNWLAGVVALLVICIPPLSYGIFSYQNLHSSVISEVEINSRIINNLINANPTLWHYEVMRLEELLALRPESGVSESRRIFDLQGRLIAASDTPLAPPLFKLSHEVMDAGQAVGRIEIIRSLQPLMLTTVIAALIGLFFGVALFVTLRILPIRAILRAEKEREKYYSFFQASTDLMCIADSHGYFLKTNPAFTEILGYSKEEFISKPILDFVHPDDRQSTLDERLRQHQSGFANPFENRYLCRDGSIKWLLWRTNFSKDEGVVYATASDITESKKAAEALMYHETQLRAIFDASQAGIVMVEPQGTISFANNSMADMFGIPLDKLIGSPYLELIHPAEKKNSENLMLKLIQGGIQSVSVERHYIRADGSDFMGLMSEKSLENPYEPLQSFVGVIVDSTEMKILQEQLSQAQKIESIGQLAGGIAHDFNNLLTIIGGNLEILQFKKLSGKPFDKQIEHIRQASVRAKTLVAQILAFSRQEKLQLGPVNLSTLVGESLSFLRSIIPTTVEVITRVPDEAVTINANTTQLQRILINICSNALHAMNEKGVLRISLEESKLTTEEALLVRGQQASRYAKLSIIDTGKGMDKKILDRIFEPFFTTKGVGDGTGMGLSVVHGIVEQHGGFIDVDSTPDQGTTFILYFPTNTIDKETDKAEVEGILPTGTERVLCVDDEQDVADVCSVMLEHLGYQVTVATDSVEALNLFKANPESFDLIVTDQTMPKISGLELAKELLAIRPEIPVILCSGYSAIVTETDALEVGVRAFCAKPMDMKQLGSVVREVLDTSEQPLVTA